MTIRGLDANEFSLTDSTCNAVGNVLVPGASCNMAVRFSPTSAGAKSATFSVTGAPGQVAGAALAGTGTVLTPITNLVVNDNLPAGCVAPNCNRDKWSVRSDFQVGLAPFGDRTFTVESTGAPELLGKAWIRTAADSKNFSGDPLATFDKSQVGCVFLLIDDRHKGTGTRPNFLVDPAFIDTGKKVVVRQSATATFPYGVWSKCDTGLKISPPIPVQLPRVFSALAPGYFVVVN